MPILMNWPRKTKVSIKGLGRSSLHAKLMALDEKQVFIGSFNFNTTFGLYSNTEIGVLLYSPQLAEAVHHTMDENFKVSLPINWS